MKLVSRGRGAKGEDLMLLMYVYELWMCVCVCVVFGWVCVFRSVNRVRRTHIYWSIFKVKPSTLRIWWWLCVSLSCWMWMAKNKPTFTTQPHRIIHLYICLSIPNADTAYRIWLCDHVTRKLAAEFLYMLRLDVCVCVKWVFWVHKVCAYGLHSHTCIRKHTQLMYKHTHTPSFCICWTWLCVPSACVYAMC